MKPDPAKNQAWGAFGAHSGVFPKIPARDIPLEPIYFRGKCAPNAPQTPAGPGADSEKMGYGEPENRRIPGLRAPPGRGPRQKGPGATMCRRLRSERTTGGTPARRPVSRRRIGSPLAAVPVLPAPARLGGSSRALAVLAASWTGRASCYPAPRLPVLRSLASQSGPADPSQRIPAHAGRPCRPPDSRPHAGFRRSCCKE